LVVARRPGRIVLGVSDVRGHRDSNEGERRGDRRQNFPHPPIVEHAATQGRISSRGYGAGGVGGVTGGVVVTCGLRCTVRGDRTSGICISPPSPTSTAGAGPPSVSGAAGVAPGTLQVTRPNRVAL